MKLIIQVAAYSLLVAGLIYVQIEVRTLKHPPKPKVVRDLQFKP